MSTPSACASPTEFVPANFDATQWKNLQPLYQALLDRKLNCHNCLERLLLDRSELDAAANEAQATLHINMTCRTDDEAIKNAYLKFVEQVEPELKKISFELDKKIVHSPHVSKLDQKRYGVLLRNLKADVDLFRPDNIPLQTEETKLVQQFEEISGAMTVKFRGEEKTLPQMAKYLEETDRSLREEAWRVVSERRYQDQEKLSDIFDAMIKLRHQMALNAGCENYLEYAFKRKHRFDYTPQDCQAFHRGAEQVCVPVYRALNTERAKALNLKSLRPWDLGVDIKGRPPLRPFEKADDLIEKTSRLFNRMDASLGEMFDSMRGGDCLDLDSRKGKAPGGYQENRDRQRKPFIFMNAAGLQRDLETMVHEAGHAFHSILCNNEPLVDYRHSPLEFAEVASMSMELLSYPYLDEFYSDADVARAKRGHLEALAKLIPWIATIDAFQHWIYTNPNHSREQRTKHWLELDARFGAVVDWTGLEPFRAALWQRQLHLFSVPLYYIEYGIAQLGALQLWLQARRNEKKALANYHKALSLGGSKPLPELFGAAELKFDFGPETMRALMDEVDGELKTLPMQIDDSSQDNLGFHPARPTPVGRLPWHRPFANDISVTISLMSEFVSHHMSAEEFRRHGRAVIDWIADYMHTVESKPVLSAVKPGDIRALLPPHPPQTGESFEAMLRDVNRIIMPGITHWQSPNFFAYFPSNNSGPSILGELMSAGLGVQGMLWATSPACTELETHVLDWLVEMLALPVKFRSESQGGGVIHDTASSAVLCALLAARERATNFATNQTGIDRQLIAYASSQAHSSLEKAIMIAGLGKDNLRLIEAPAAGGFAMNPESFQQQIASDLKHGFTPFFICATVGTTSSNAIDPVRAIGTVARQHNLWLHVDSAMAGSAALCPEFRHIHDGVEHADSYCFNPHKWMFTNFDCSCFFVADRNALIKTLSVLPEYLKNKSTESGAVIDYRDWQIPLGRRFRALKLWFVIRHYGIDGLQRHVREHIRLAQEFASWVKTDVRFELACDPPLNLVCFRHTGGDDINQRMMDNLNATGKLYLTHTRLDGKLTLRVCVGQAQTTAKHVEEAWRLIRDAAP